MNERKELAKEAAKAAVLATARYTVLGPKNSVDVFLEAYDYAIEKLIEKEKQQTPHTNFFEEQEAKGFKIG